MKTLIKTVRLKTLTVKISKEEHTMVKELRASKVDLPRMVRNLIHNTYKGINNNENLL